MISILFPLLFCPIFKKKKKQEPVLELKEFHILLIAQKYKIPSVAIIKQNVPAGPKDIGNKKPPICFL